MADNNFDAISKKLNNISRRDFMKFCTVMAASMGLPLEVAPQIAEAVTSPKRPPVIWLSGQGCTGCTESLLRPTHPSLEHLILDLISLDYNETLNVGAGHQAEEAMRQSIEANSKQFILVVEGAIPTRDGGVYCMVGGRPFMEIVRETADKAAAVIAIGSCASWGGIAAAEPNPTGATGAPEFLVGKPVVSIPGCPPNGYNFLSTVLHYLTFKKLPDLDAKGRPKFAYGRLIHENCERRPHFDAGRFATQFGDDGHRQGFCLYKLGCKGPQTYANCPSILFNEVGGGAWPVGTGHPCFGCTEQGVGFAMPLHEQADLKFITPAADHAPVTSDRGGGVSAAAAALIGAGVGVAAGAAAMTARRLAEADKNDDGGEAS